MLIRYKNVIIDGKDKSGKTEDVPIDKAQRLIEQGYAEAEIREPAEVTRKIRKRKKQGG